MKALSPSNLMPNVQTVSRLPSRPQSEAHYSFQNISRKEVTRSNHSLHKYPAKFIPQFAQWALQYKRGGERESVLDPFCGCGTSLVEAGLLGDQVFGLDISPLAVLISKAKTATLRGFEDDVENTIRTVVDRASRLLPKILATLVEGAHNELGQTWSYWFRPPEVARLIALREAIVRLYRSRNPELATILLACLSSISKGSSFLDEDQIKVRFDLDKTPADPFTTFPILVASALETQKRLGRAYLAVGSQFWVCNASATAIPLGTSSIDRIITSPPYINAIDYTMAHRYNLFLLNLIRPRDFKDHCREYIGVTERAVRVADLRKMPRVDNLRVRREVSLLLSIDTPVARNRAFVVAQFFSGMQKALSEFHRVLKPKGRAIVLVGNSNRICGLEIETASLIEQMAGEVGFKTELRFYHQLANRSSMRLGRSETGGMVKIETVYVFLRS